MIVKKLRKIANRLKVGGGVSSEGSGKAESAMRKIERLSDVSHTDLVDVWGESSNDWFNVYVTLKMNKTQRIMIKNKPYETVYEFDFKRLKQIIHEINKIIKDIDGYRINIEPPRKKKEYVSLEFNEKAEYFYLDNVIKVEFNLSRK